jgi:hypothetical protein
MPWVWVLLWAVLLLGAGLVLGLLGRMLWRKAKALTREVGEATEGLTAVLAALNDVADPVGYVPAPSPARRPGARGRRRDRGASPH